MAVFLLLKFIRLWPGCAVEKDLALGHQTLLVSVPSFVHYLKHTSVEVRIEGGCVTQAAAGLSEPRNSPCGRIQ